jgi:hypothetical protein
MRDGIVSGIEYQAMKAIKQHQPRGDDVQEIYAFGRLDERLKYQVDLVIERKDEVACQGCADLGYSSIKTQSI